MARQPVARDLWYGLRLVAGWLLVVLGVVFFPLPVPLGLVLIAVGVGVLAHDSRFLRRHLAAFGRRNPATRERIVAGAGRLSARLSRYLRKLLGS